MEKDRTAICNIISTMLDNPDKHGIYSTSTAYARLEHYIEGIRAEAIGWTHADNCVALDHNKDPRLKNVPDMLFRAQKDLSETQSDRDICRKFVNHIQDHLEPGMEKREYFSALNEKDAEKYIGKTMEFADVSDIRKNKWVKDKLSIIAPNHYSFEAYDGSGWEFCRTCPETFAKKKVKKTVERWANRYSWGVAEQAYRSIKIAEDMATDDAIEVIKLTGEYEDLEE